MHRMEGYDEHGISYNKTLDVKIKDFSTTNEQIAVSDNQEYHDFEMMIFASAFPNGYHEEGRDWLLVIVEDIVCERIPLLIDGKLSYIVSIIDIHGKSRSPQSFGGYVRHKYLKRSFVLDGADEFLPNDVLTLRFDISYLWSRISVTVFDVSPNYKQVGMRDFFFAIPQLIYSKEEDQKFSGTIFDFTGRIFSLPLFDETINTLLCRIPQCAFPWSIPGSKSGDTDTLGHTIIDLTLPNLYGIRKRYGLFRYPGPFPCSSPESKSNDPDTWDHIWIFDIKSDKYILSLKENPGAQLLEKSPVIRRCVNTAMREQREKRIDLSHVDSDTFQMLLFILTEGQFPVTSMQESVKFYELCHLYQIEGLLQKTVDFMMYDRLTPRIFANLKEIANQYSDDYFLNKLDEYEKQNIITKESETDERPDVDCYI